MRKIMMSKQETILATRAIIQREMKERIARIPVITNFRATYATSKNNLVRINDKTFEENNFNRSIDPLYLDFYHKKALFIVIPLHIHQDYENQEYYVRCGVNSLFCLIDIPIEDIETLSYDCKDIINAKKYIDDNKDKETEHVHKYIQNKVK